MSASHPQLITGAELEVLSALADVLIPEADDMPSASASDPAGKWLARVLRARPDFVEPLKELAAAAVEEDPERFVRRLRDQDRASFDVLGSAVTGAYLINKQIRRGIGYPGQKANPIIPGDDEYYLRDDVLAPVEQLEPTWNPAPDPPPAAAPRAIPRHHGDRADVLIIGAGASGSVAAKVLAEQGFRVVCLEQGRWMNASEFPGDTREYELHMGGAWNPDPNVRGWAVDYPVNVEQSDVSPVMFNAVGGSTVHYGGQWSRMRPVDFATRALHGVGDDWPVSYQELLPFYERMEADMGVCGHPGNPAYPAPFQPPLPALPIGEIGRRAGEGMNKLGWHWWPAYHAIASRPYRDRPPCARRGTCMFGCPEGAKGSTDITLWPSALRHGAKLITGARVRRVTTDAQGLATGADWIDRDGAEHHQAADVIIVGANGVGTPRLLLLSASPQHPEGLANSSGLVGRRLMMHPYMSVLGTYEDELESWVGPFGSPIISLQFGEIDERRGFAGGAQWDLQPSGGPHTVLDRFNDLEFDARWGPSMHRLLRRTFNHAFDWGIGIEDFPSEENRVVLDPNLTDADGIPSPRILYRTDAESRKNLAFQIERATEAHQAAGAIETLVSDWSAWGWHLLGTARMGDDPATSVVNRWGQTHDVPNLYIFDGSVFPTSGPMAPTATLCAFALRCAEQLAADAGNQRLAA